MDFANAIRNIVTYGPPMPSLDDIPTDIADFVISDGIPNIINQVGLKYGLDETQRDALNMVIGLYVTKVINGQLFVNLLSLSSVQEKYFDAFRHDLQDRLWEPYDAALNQEKIPYKLLTKLSPEPREKIEEYINQTYRTPETTAKEEAQKQQDFSLGDQIKIFSNQSAAQSLSQPQEIKMAMPGTSFTPAQEQTVKPIEITVAKPEVTQTQQTAPQAKQITQPATQVRLEISSSQAVPQTPEQPEKVHEEQSATFVLPSVRFEPLLQKQEGMIPKQATPSTLLQETLGKLQGQSESTNSVLETKQEVKETNAQKLTTNEMSPEQEKSPEQKPTSSVIDLTNWSVSQ